jgi:hypothetical protein
MTLTTKIYCSRQYVEIYLRFRCSVFLVAYICLNFGVKYESRYKMNLLCSEVKTTFALKCY